MTFIEPQYHRHEEFVNRTKKLQEIKELGIDPFPPIFSPTATLGQITEQSEGKELGNSEDAEKATTPSICLGGRLVLFRAMGKKCFWTHPRRIWTPADTI